MNTVRSTWFGWAGLCVAGGGSYYFAKKSINADKKKRFEADMKRKQIEARMEEEERSHHHAPPPSSRKGKAGGPSGEASFDPAATDHAEGGGKPAQKSKYEPTEPYRTKKGDRFS